MITRTTKSAENVLAGWFGLPIPAMPRQRRRPYRKTAIRRSEQRLREPRIASRRIAA